MTETQPPSKQEQLFGRYQDLSPLEGSVVELCAVLSEKVPNETLFACLTGLAAKDLPGLAELETLLAGLRLQHLLDQHNRCHPAVVELICRNLPRGRFQQLAASVQQLLPTGDDFFSEFPSRAAHRFLRDLRIAIYNHDLDQFNSVLLAYFRYPGRDSFPNPVARICNNPFDPEWFTSVPLQVQLYALNEIYKASLAGLHPLAAMRPFLEKQLNRRNIPANARKSFLYLMVVQLLLCGDIQQAREIIDQHKKLTPTLGLSGSLLFLSNSNEDALASFNDDLAELCRINDDDDSYFTGIEGVLFIVAMLKTGNFSFLEPIRKALAAVKRLQPHNPLTQAYIALGYVVQALENKLDLKSFRHFLQLVEKQPNFTTLFAGLASYWITGKVATNLTPGLALLLNKATTNGLRWPAAELARLLETASSDEPPAETTGLPTMTDAVAIEEPWQRALKALVQSTSQPSSAAGAERSRLAWFIIHNPDTNDIAIIPKEQRLTEKRLWTKGRLLSLKKLHGGELPSFFTTQDQKIIACLENRENPWGTSYHFDIEKALPALIGHPHIFFEGGHNQQVEFVRGEPQLRVAARNNLFQLRFYPEISGKRVLLVKESPTRFKIYEISDEHLRVAYIIGEHGLNVPEEAKEEVLAVLGNVSSFMTVHSEVHGESDVTTTVAASTTIHILLHPYGSGLKLSLFVKPFKSSGPYLKPGEGGQNLIAEIDGRRLQTMRDLEAERQAVLHVEERCPSLLLGEEIGNEWLISEPEKCLELLVELQDMGDEILIEWPEGEKFTVSRQITTDQFHVHIRKKSDWFQVDGKLAIDDDLVLDMHKLLELTKTSTGRFIPLGDGQFLTLTEELRRRIDDLNLYSDRKGKNLRLNPLAAVVLNDFSDSGIHLETDNDWTAQIRRIEEAKDFQPQLPAAFKADLRDYQLEGYNWLARLAHWGVGACLADDMGLGKTVQALAIIVERASKGPTLVVAPTSVCLNWKNEASRFAPNMKIKLFKGKKRGALVKDLREQDMLIVSYALLQQEAELLQSVDWQTIVLDEAQAIKNMATKRSKAAMSLSGRYKLITTGTPIENHLGELWNLFHFINPGLLGSYRQFANRYINPIERHQDRTVRKKLKKIIRPFILRRIKSQVLDELPPRTEVTLQVEMSPKEAALYEALRQQALKKIGTAEQPGRKHLTILAEITRLRRACCNPSLVVPGTTIKSSKFELFQETIAELLENRHKVLVFSQFVDHLAILRRHLDERQISHRYIDGSTPIKQRQQEVDLFQAGQGDIFLISLKAGGLGLNLTAADYVIHMDPWWNPAVEDQASDRAHRIGQQQPVTVYRLVTQNTIEEKIIALHKEKRELADGLLEGADISDRITAEELLDLLQNQ